MNVYYQRMADDYRQKYLDLEREYIYLKNGFDYELQKSRQALTDAENRYNDKLSFELQEVDRKHREVISQKDYQIN